MVEHGTSCFKRSWYLFLRLQHQQISFFTEKRSQTSRQLGTARRQSRSWREFASCSDQRMQRGVGIYARVPTTGSIGTIHKLRQKLCLPYFLVLGWSGIYSHAQSRTQRLCLAGQRLLAKAHASWSLVYTKSGLCTRQTETGRNLKVENHTGSWLGTAIGRYFMI